MDLQRFTVGRRFAVKKVAVLRKGTILSHYIYFFARPPYHGIILQNPKSSMLLG